MSIERAYETRWIPRQIEALICRRGHIVPIPAGVFVQTHLGAGVNMYTTLGEKRSKYQIPDDEKLTMGDAGVGSVVAHDWHLCPLELNSSEIDPPSYNTGDPSNPHAAKIHGVYEHMWYLVAFKKGLFWARWNWIEVITEPV